MITKREFLFKTLPVALAAALSVGMDVEEHNEREERFKRRVIEHMKNGNEPALRKEIWEHFDFASSDQVNLNYAVERNEAKQDHVEILQQPMPEVALGCVLIVITVTIVVFGVIIYLIIQACKNTSGGTNAPPRIPPDNGGTNYAPNIPVPASHSGGTANHH